MLKIADAQARRIALSIALRGNASEIYEALLARGLIPDIVTDQTSAHDLVYGYIPAGLSIDEVKKRRVEDPESLIALGRSSIVRHVGAMLAFRKAGAVVFDNGNLIRTQAKIGGEAREAFPARERVADRLGELCLLADQPEFLTQPRLKIGDDRAALFLAHGTTLLGGSCTDVVFRLTIL